MPLELIAVAATSMILLVLVFAQQLTNDIQKGAAWALSNRDDQTFSPLAARLARASQNHIENVALFVPVALAVVLLDLTSPLTAWGAGIFLAGRVGHSLSYGLGVAYIRSAFWMAGVAGTVMVGWPLIRALL